MPSDPSVAPSRAPTALHQSLLHEVPARCERRASSRWAYSSWGIAVVSVFVLYHVSVLLVWNIPSKSLTREFHKSFLEQVEGYAYFRGTHNDQSWEMFAPNPTRINQFVQVLVEDREGQLWDFEQDIWGEDRYPYLWYDRRGKINRRIDGKKGYQNIYGAWVCREWERHHGGEPARSVTFVLATTRVPPPDVVLERGGWSQWRAPVERKEQHTVTCKTVVNGQLPNRLRARYGLEQVDEHAVFRPVRARTWWDQRESES